MEYCPYMKTRSQVLAEIRQDKLKIRKQQNNEVLEIIAGLTELGIGAGIVVARHLAKWAFYAVLAAVAVVIGFVIHALCPLVFWLLLILIICAWFAPSVETQAKRQIALLDEMKKQLDARK